jgi:(2R)-3-sulfolactate dehydrogenase (NADP+)
MPIVAWDVLEDLGARLLVDCGVEPDVARRSAGLAVFSQAFGAPSHGVRLIKHTVDGVEQGRLNPAAQPVVVRDHGASVLIDGRHCLATPALDLAKQCAVRGARRYGIAAASVRNIAWAAALGPHLHELPADGLCAQLWVHFAPGKVCAPHGGIDGRFSTNPIALAFPVGDDDAMIADFSLSAHSMGVRGLMLRAGERSPEASFLTPDGTLTDDPAAVGQGGSMLPTGGAHFGYKGHALELFSEMTALLAGNPANVPDHAQPRQSAFLIVIDPQRFAGLDHLVSSMRAYVAHLKTSRRRQGFEEIRLPGQRGARAVRQARARGVDVPDHTLDELAGLARERGFEPGF